MTSPVSRAISKPEAVSSQRVAVEAAGCCSGEPDDLGREVGGVHRVRGQLHERRGVGTGPERGRLAPPRAGPARSSPGPPAGTRHPSRPASSRCRRAPRSARPTGATPACARTAAVARHSAVHQRVRVDLGPGRRRPVERIASVASAMGTPSARHSAALSAEVPWSRVRTWGRAHGGVTVPSRSHRSSHDWPAFHRNTWPLISRQSRSIPRSRPSRLRSAARPRRPPGSPRVAPPGRERDRDLAALDGPLHAHHSRVDAEPPAPPRR